MRSYTVYVGLGSNVGDRASHLQAAAVGLRQCPGVTIVQHSSVYESDPYGKKDQPRFLNAVTELETTLRPAELLEHLKSLEQAVGRQAQERWGPREIDIDILVYDGLVCHEDGLHVPHRDLVNRKFVLVPLREVAPDLVHPESGMTVDELAGSCKDDGRVVKTSYRLPL
jgi:2-amino-4-hydroxy-6-hydroxymethyldihydropteridine diphosphokinase